MRVYKSVRHRPDQGLGICIFPEGGVPEEAVVLDQFKDGAFKMAINHKIPIAPMTFLDCKKRLPFRFFSGGPGRLRVIVHAIIPTDSLQLEDANTIKNTTRNTILLDLQKDQESGPYPSYIS